MDLRKEVEVGSFEFSRGKNGDISRGEAFVRSEFRKKTVNFSLESWVRIIKECV